MTGFASYLEKNPIRKAGVVATWGRFNPPTKGHETVFNEAARLANLKGYDLKIFATHSHDQNRNPLDYDLKMEYLQAIFPRYKNYFVLDGGSQFTKITDILETTQIEYDNFVLIVGEDRVDDFSRMLIEQEGGATTFRSTEVWSSGERDPDCDDIRGVSASQMREYAAAGATTEFLEGLPAGVDAKLGRALMEDVRRGLIGDDQPTPPLVLERTEAREDLFAGEIIEGCQVRTAQGPGIVQSVGANYYVVILENEIKKLWPKDVERID
jgi:hypothetical protein